MVDLFFDVILPSIRNWVLVLDGGVLYCAIGNHLTTQDSIFSNFTVCYLSSVQSHVSEGRK